MSLGNNGPSSRPPQHPSLYPSPYDDPYYYYGTQERGARTATALQDPMFKSSGYGNTGLYDVDGGGEPSFGKYLIIFHIIVCLAGYRSYISIYPGFAQLSP